MTEEDDKNQYTGMSTMAGNVGYLREAYHGGPYATKILCREAFDAENGEAEIPAAVLRERLTHVTEPALGRDGGHMVAQMIAQFLSGANLSPEVEVIPPAVRSGITQPMTVEEAIRTRYATVYPETDQKHVDDVVESFRAFVALAEQKEKETGHPCTVYASY